ncbi:hypothetical protein CFIMG_007431RA00001 [Ceratocystis fimbriata CBS 114723]|uniref:Phosphatidylinositol N-acetylglucosaminyltransferase subunit H conserved domain-containing protein n=1 Tax=Ceratocystis fimbriata CBS 114723 TaxID=1035309 RepID=A0A2C5WXK1_9PEZI|nr:hypothetical protein CFIMG_007431RA00001 [Ceratocystis fimbriata CBS 114723]
MLATTPYLTKRCPSSTTVEYTVSNRPRPSFSQHLKASALALLRALIIASAALILWGKWNQPDCSTGLFPSTSALSRVGYAAAAAATPFSSVTTTALTAHLASALKIGPTPLSARYTPGISQRSCADVPVFTDWPLLLQAVNMLPFGTRVHWAVSRGPLAAVMVVCLAVMYTALLRVHAAESLLVLRGLGIQTSSVAAGSLLGAPASTRFIPTEKIQDVLVNEAFHGFEVRYYLLIVVDGEEDVVVVFPKLLPGKDVVTTVWRGVKACLYEGPPDGMKMRDA